MPKVDIETLFQDRWRHWRPRLRSELWSKGAERPAVELGLPILIPEYASLGHELHRQIGLEDAAELKTGRRVETPGFVAGYPVWIRGLGKAQPPLSLTPIPEDPQHARCHDAQGQQWQVTLRADYHGRELDTKAVFATFPEPPLLVTHSRFPEPASVTLYEVLPYLAAPQPAFGIDEPQADVDSRAMAEQQEPFLRWLLSLFPTTDSPICVDVGCGAGWLSGALALAGAAEVLGFDLRRGSMSGFAHTFPEASRSLLAVGDMFTWPLRDTCVDLICIRNNSAFAFAETFANPQFHGLLQACADSLRPQGLVYLSNGSGQRHGDFSNLSAANLHPVLQATGLKACRLMRHGSMTGWLLGRKDDAQPALTAAVAGQRRQAWAEASAAGEGFVRDRNSTCLLMDLCAATVLHCLDGPTRRATLHGPPSLCSEILRYLPAVYPECPAELRRGQAGKHLRLELEGHDASRAETITLLTSDRATPAEAADASWKYHFLSADHDAASVGVLEATPAGQVHDSPRRSWLQGLLRLLRRG